MTYKARSTFKYKVNIHALISKLNNIMKCTGIPSVCVSPM